MHISINKLVIQYIDQKTHLVIYNKLQIILRNAWKLPLLHVSATECHLQGVYGDTYNELCSMKPTLLYWGTAVAQWLRCCATNRKVAGSIPDGVIGIFHWHNAPDRTMALGSTHPLTETGEFPGGKCGRCVGLTTLPPPCAVVMKSGNLNFLEPSGPLQACNGTDLPLPFALLYSVHFLINMLNKRQCAVWVI